MALLYFSDWNAELASLSLVADVYPEFADALEIVDRASSRTRTFRFEMDFDVVSPMTATTSAATMTPYRLSAALFDASAFSFSALSFA